MSPPTPEEAQRVAALAELVDELRPVGFGLAYRMLGRAGPADDVVGEAFLRLHHTLGDGERVDSPRTYLSTAVTRLCIDRVRAARARARRGRPGERLPEPLIAPAAGDTGDTGDAADTGDTGDTGERADSLSLGFLLLLDGLSPEPRAAFLLHDVFDHPYDQVAAIVATSEENARRLVTRARRHVEPRRPRFEPSRARRAQVARQFFAAAQAGDLGDVEDLLAPDVTLHDGGRRPLGGPPHQRNGRERVARTLLARVRPTTRDGASGRGRPDPDRHLPRRPRSPDRSPDRSGIEKHRSRGRTYRAGQEVAR